eukprot:CAMPEP_0180324194 /NCGR_PEP_ID=MMETSP0988-20121125/37723_1 /TAXON_ID=697907 /ORGANISM="non described non described, Strain CCMP2293" /LENGTH=37 /DNA_ID= /DNA_START= /DNA_END= /DNA_ORIENTATION=
MDDGGHVLRGVPESCSWVALVATTPETNDDAWLSGGG